MIVKWSHSLSIKNNYGSDLCVTTMLSWPHKSSEDEVFQKEYMQKKLLPVCLEIDYEDGYKQ